MSTTAFMLPRLFAHRSQSHVRGNSVVSTSSPSKRYKRHGPVQSRAPCLPYVCQKSVFTVEHKNHTGSAVSQSSQYPSASVSQPFTLLGSACISPPSPCGCFRKLA